MYSTIESYIPRNGMERGLGRPGGPAARVSVPEFMGLAHGLSKHRLL
jgi:hypothetical protein